MGADAPITVGVLTASVSRQAGGLYWAIPPLVNAIKRTGCAIKVFSVADAGDDEDAAHWGAVVPAAHGLLGPRAFGYAPRLSRALNAANVDLVHTHGLWMYPSVAAWHWGTRWRRPLVVSPHGMLDPWAVRNSAWKKRIAGLLFENRHLRRAACLHALNDAEYEAIRAYGLTSPIAVIPNGVDPPGTGRDRRHPRGASGLDDDRVLLFLGRLHPKKGLAGLLHAWAWVQRQAVAEARRWRLVIAGWEDSPGYEAELRRLVSTLQLGDTVRLVGPQHGARKDASFARADAFILPSLSEGLPMAVLEAWAHRVPVLMTSHCHLLAGFAAGAALEIDTDVDRMAEALAAFLSLPEEERRAMGARGLRLVEDCFAWESIAGRMVEVYRWLIERGKQPGCVIED